MSRGGQTQCDWLLWRLREAGPHGLTSREIIEDGQIFQYNARILELRRLGHNIEKEKVKGTLYRYVLKFDAGRAKVGELGLVYAERGGQNA